MLLRLFYLSYLDDFFNELKADPAKRELYMNESPGALLRFVIEMLFESCFPKLDHISEKLDYIENVVEYITPEFDYYNKQIHNLQVYNIDNIRIYFDEYLEDGNIYYNIYSRIEHDYDTVKFIDIINKLV